MASILIMLATFFVSPQHRFVGASTKPIVTCLASITLKPRTALCEPTVGRKLVPHTTIRAREEKKDLRFEREARNRLQKFIPIVPPAPDATYPLEHWKPMDPETVKDLTGSWPIRPMTHEQRQALIRQPIVFNYYGSKSSVGTGVCDESRMNRVYSTRPSRIQDGDSHD